LYPTCRVVPESITQKGDWDTRVGVDEVSGCAAPNLHYLQSVSRLLEQVLVSRRRTVAAVPAAVTATAVVVVVAIAAAAAAATPVPAALVPAAAAAVVAVAAADAVADADALVPAALVLAALAAADALVPAAAAADALVPAAADALVPVPVVLVDVPLREFLLALLTDTVATKLLWVPNSAEC
jgi:hypothetical protein